CRCRRRRSTHATRSVCCGRCASTPATSCRQRPDYSVARTSLGSERRIGVEVGFGFDSGEGCMSRLQQETFKIFISHKLSDKDLAELVVKELEALGGGRIDCWMSGQDLSAGVDWTRQTKHNLAESHLPVLLFTTPALNWDWCLFEVGLFTHFEAEDVSSVVCLYDPAGLPPGPLNQVQ